MTAIDYPTATAGELAAAVRNGKVSAVELTDLAIARIEAMDGAINAVVVRDFERARADAKAADSALAQGAQGALLGVPMTVKESYDLKGFPTTWGTPALLDYRATEEAAVVQRLRRAGAIVLGKTNVPPMLGDWQSGNPIYGRTNNPLDLSRTPGGSSGGAAAAVAAGYVALEMGGDIGGSIRVPATFCGIYGHKPSFGVVPTWGQAPGGLRGAAPALAVCGPLARSASDLALALSVVAGPWGDEAKGYGLTLPPPRHRTLRDYRVLMIDTHPRAATGADVNAALHQLAVRLEGEGASVSRDASLLPDMGESMDVFMSMLLTIVTRRGPDEPGERPPISSYAWMDLLDAQARIRRQWAALFEDFDVAVAPAFGTCAFHHFDEPDWRKRTLRIDGVDTPFGGQMAWASQAIVANLPATAMPLGLGVEGMPIGAQVIGPYLEDLTTIAFAELVGRR
jgi:amidase